MTDSEPTYRVIQTALTRSHFEWNRWLLERGQKFQGWATEVIHTLITLCGRDVLYIETLSDEVAEGASVHVYAFTSDRVVEIHSSLSAEGITKSAVTYGRQTLKAVELHAVRGYFDRPDYEIRQLVFTLRFSEHNVTLGEDLWKRTGELEPTQQAALLELYRGLLRDVAR